MCAAILWHLFPLRRDLAQTVIEMYSLEKTHESSRELPFSRVPPHPCPGELNAWQVYAALIPIIGGVGIASAAEMSFNWLCFGAAMGSNIGSASRAVYTKMVMGKGNIGKNMDSSNVYAVLTIMATFMLIPIAFAIEGPSSMIAGFKVALAKGGTPFLMSMIYSGLYYYLYNEAPDMMGCALGLVGLVCRRGIVSLSISPYIVASVCFASMRAGR